jgi:hypothetical protein
LKDDVISAHDGKLSVIEVEYGTKITGLEVDFRQRLQNEINCHSLIKQERDALKDEVENLKSLIEKYKREVDHDIGGDVDTWHDLYENMKHENEEIKRLLVHKQRELEIQNRRCQEEIVRCEELEYRGRNIDPIGSKHSGQKLGREEQALVGNFLLGIELTRLAYIHNQNN